MSGQRATLRLQLAIAVFGACSPRAATVNPAEKPLSPRCALYIKFGDLHCRLPPVRIYIVELRSGAVKRPETNLAKLTARLRLLTILFRKPTKAISLLVSLVSERASRLNISSKPESETGAYKSKG